MKLYAKAYAVTPRVEVTPWRRPPAQGHVLSRTFDGLSATLLWPWSQSSSVNPRRCAAKSSLSRNSRVWSCRRTAQKTFIIGVGSPSVQNKTPDQ